MGQVGEASKSSTSTSKALKKFAEKAHEVAASKADEEDEEDDEFEDASTDIDDPDKVPKVRYPKSPPTLDTTSLGPGHQDWLSKTYWQWTQYNSHAAHLLEGWAYSHEAKSEKFLIQPGMRELHDIVSAGLMASITGRARQRVKAALRKAYGDETINQCFDENGKIHVDMVLSEKRLKKSIYYIWQALNDTDEKSAQKYLDLISNTVCTNPRHIRPHLQRMDEYYSKYASCIGD